MAHFIVITSDHHSWEKLMEIVRTNSMMYNNAYGGGNYCETEIHGNHNIIQSAIDSGHLKAFIEFYE